MSDVPLDKVSEFEKLFIQTLKVKYQAEVLDVLKSGVINDDVTAKLAEVAKQVAANYKN